MSSSSCEDENVVLLKEAVSTDFISNGLYQQNRQTKTTTKTIKLPSLRIKDDDCDNQYDNLGVTNGFQQHIANHLVVMLDKLLKSNIDFSSKEYKAKKRKGGVKLFSNSENSIKKFKEEILPIYKKKIVKEDSDEDFEDKIKSVVVQTCDILSKKDTLNWSNISKAKIFQYKCKKGVLYEME